MTDGEAPPRRLGVARWAMRRLRGGGQYALLAVALVIGVGAAYAAIVFYEAIALLDAVLFRADLDAANAASPAFPIWLTLLIPSLCGLVVGVVVHRFAAERRPEGVADVIDACALRGRSLTLKDGLLHAVVSIASIGCGASVGREGPVVHLGASLAAWLSERLRLGRANFRTLLGCGVAAAVAASFNAPIAGVFFALEVVIGHYALNAFAPIVIASVAGAMISREHFGDFPAFIAPPYEIASALEFPAFALLGAVGAVIALAFIHAVFVTQNAFNRARAPRWARPAVCGLAVGAIAVWFPEVLGVGYGSTDAAIKGHLDLTLLLGLLAAKLAATALSLGAGFGGGVFSPSLFIGAMAGGAFGVIAAGVFPELASNSGVYALVGTGAVAGAVLGAPISTILMVFELSANYQLTVAVMVATVVAATIVRQVDGYSYFGRQLLRLGRDLRRGRSSEALEGIQVGAIMRRSVAAVPPDADLETVRGRLPFAPHGELYVVDAERRLLGAISGGDMDPAALAMRDGADARIAAPDADKDAPAGPRSAADLAQAEPPMLTRDDNLERARALLETSGESQLPVVEGAADRRLVGVLDARDLLRALHEAMSEHPQAPPRAAARRRQ